MTFYALNFGNLVDLEERDDEVTKTSGDLANEVMKLTGRGPSGQALDDAALSRLAPEERREILEALVRAHHSFFEKTTFRCVPNDSGGSTLEASDTSLIVPRLEGELAEDYFFRGYRHFRENFAETFRPLSAQLAAFSKSLRSSLAAPWSDNLKASEQLSKNIRGLFPSKNAFPSVKGIARSTPVDLEKFVNLPNPAHTTNDLLGEVAAELTAMREITASAAEMQQSLNEIAKTILTEFSTGAAQSAQAAADGLEISKNSLATSRNSFWVAVGSAVLALVAIAIQALSNSDGRTERKAELAVEARSRSELTKAQQTLKAAIDRQTTMLEQQERRAAEAAAKKPSANRSK
ncbi:MAG TPA: hypothetical protein VFP12_06235 [Allosphingosinicella sp.]|nr:hypothetical protein [Allosphingosinicella sp.]